MSRRWAGTTRADLYPDCLLPIVRTAYEDATEADDFDILREQLVLSYGYNTARAYRRDLEDWRDWCAENGAVDNVLLPEPDNIENFLADRLQTGYSPNTVARRLTTLRGFYDLVDARNNPARLVHPIRRTCPSF